MPRGRRQLRRDGRPCPGLSSRTSRRASPVRLASVSLLSTLLAAVALPAPAAPATSLVDVTADSGIRYRNICGAEPIDKKLWISESMGAGGAWLDYDGDGHLDLFLVNGSTYDRPKDGGEPNQLFKGDGKGKFVDVTEKAGVGHRGWGYGVAVGDIDNDGDPDLYVTNFGPNALFRNNGDGTFTEIGAQAGVARDDGWSTSVAFLDVENDGDLDLYVGNYMVADRDKVPARGSEAAAGSNCNYKGIAVYCGPMGQVPIQNVLYRNDGKGKFTDVTRESGLYLDTPRFTLGMVTLDFDNDGDQDIYVANDSVRNSLWRNDGAGKFTDVGVESLVALNADGRAQAGMGTDAADYSGDGWPDLVVTNFAHDTNTIYRNLSGKFFMDETAIGGLSVTNLFLSWGVGFQDFDHDADLDLFIANGHIYPEVDGFDIGTRYKQPNHLFLNEGGRFRESSAASGPAFENLRSHRAAVFGDYDDDGDVDVFVTTLSDHGTLLRNDTGSGHWLTIRLVGESANRDGVGARVIVTTETGSQLRQRHGGGSYLSAADPRLHFGLGAATTVKQLDVLWPGGEKETFRDVAVDRAIVIHQGRGIVQPN